MRTGVVARIADGAVELTFRLTCALAERFVAGDCNSDRRRTQGPHDPPTATDSW